MFFKGKALKLSLLETGIYQISFDLQDSSVNKFDKLTLSEFSDALDLLEKQIDLKGVLICSSKSTFIVGADITEFTDQFKKDATHIAGLSKYSNDLFARLEDLPCATVAAINGMAMGGGFEICLACDYRVMSASAQVGLPEVKLGLMPGWGGSIRLPRLIGIDNAIEWICGGSAKRPEDALAQGAVDAVVAADDLNNAAFSLLKENIAGKYDFKVARNKKMHPVALNDLEKTMAFESASAVVGAKAGKNYPAPMVAIETIKKHVGLDRTAAIEIESRAFAHLAKTDAASSLIGIFLKDQMIKRLGKKHTKLAEKVNKAAVLGAGIMGGGVAYQSASKGTPIVMKDINDDALQAGLQEADKLLLKQIERKRMDASKMASILNKIQPTLSYGDFSNVDLVVEAVVENPKIKMSVLAEVEQNLPDSAILASNTSTISISQLATAVKRPENFCGMHFFNPVHVMPLVEVIRGEKSSDTTIATTVAYALSMGKKPIVIRDCPGFLVNRILFPYFAGFTLLLNDGADFKRIDKIMENFGWPMGPAYLLDVVGIDTSYHAAAVLAEGFPDRMGHEGDDAIDLMFHANRFGQKSGEGFYRYEMDKRGKPKKILDETAYDVIHPTQKQTIEITDEQIVDRMMIPLCLETVRCLEDGIVDSAAEADMGLVYGIGFPPFRGGALQYIDKIGVQVFCDSCKPYEALGKAYHPTAGLLKMAEENKTFFQLEERA